MDIELNFINRSNNSNDLLVVIVQRNEATVFDERVVAWRVIRSCGPGDNHRFSFSMEMHVGVIDGYGRRTALLPAQYGQLFEYGPTSRGDDELRYFGPGTDPREVQVQNVLGTGAIDACIYKSDRLLATEPRRAPIQTARFKFKHSIWIGVVSEAIEEGESLYSGRLSEINTEISLLGIASADIVLTGSGSSSTSTPFQFSLGNVVEA